MNDPARPANPDQPEEIAPSPPVGQRFVDRNDWLAFAITTFLSLSVYLFTLSPSIDLGNSGTFATGAFYLGVPDVPGYPLWTIYAWLFSVLLPTSNVAWRMNVASAIAAALACGVAALLTSRCAGDILREHPKNSLDASEAKAIRLVCATAAGLALAFDHGFWSYAVILSPWTLSVLFFAITLALFLRWQHEPRRTRWFNAAVFMYGLTLNNSQALAPAALGFEFLILCTDISLARDVFAATTIVLATILLGGKFDFLPALATQMPQVISMSGVYEVLGFFTLLMTGVLAFATRSFFTRWRSVLAGTIFIGLGFTPYLLLPVFSMANPPLNWGYPRTVEGFDHVLSRGQFEVVHPPDTLERFCGGLEGYTKGSFENFGIYCMIAALLPFGIIHRLQTRQRRSLFSLLFVFLSLSLFVIYLINPSTDRVSQDLHEHFYSPSRLVLAVLAGCGLAIIGANIASFGNTSK